MKVRYDGKLYEWVGEWVHPSGTLFRVLETAFERKLVDPHSCTTVEDTWQDVTAECTIELDVFAKIYHKGFQIDSIRGYRIRKVQLPALPVDIMNIKFLWRDAFIIERKVE